MKSWRMTWAEHVAQLMGEMNNAEKILFGKPGVVKSFCTLKETRLNNASWN
jgi:hypothetical protein